MTYMEIRHAKFQSLVIIRFTYFIRVLGFLLFKARLKTIENRRFGLKICLEPFSCNFNHMNQLDIPFINFFQ